ncbi:uncharacterized [Tachysurus ichikawai]
MWRRSREHGEYTEPGRVFRDIQCPRAMPHSVPAALCTECLAGRHSHGMMAGEMRKALKHLPRRCCVSPLCEAGGWEGIAIFQRTLFIDRLQKHKQSRGQTVISRTAETALATPSCHAKTRPL